MQRMSGRSGGGVQQNTISLGACKRMAGLGLWAAAALGPGTIASMKLQCTGLRAHLKAHFRSKSARSRCMSQYGRQKWTRQMAIRCCMKQSTLPTPDAPSGAHRYHHHTLPIGPLLMLGLPPHSAFPDIPIKTGSTRAFSRRLIDEDSALLRVCPVSAGGGCPNRIGALRHFRGPHTPAGRMARSNAEHLLYSAREATSPSVLVSVMSKTEGPTLLGSTCYPISHTKATTRPLSGFRSLSAFRRPWKRGSPLPLSCILHCGFPLH